MSCCGNHNHGGKPAAQKDGQASGKKKYNLMMIVCCVFPIALAAIIFLTNTTSGTLGNVLPILLLMICPLSHLLIMPLIMKKNKNHHHT